ncbi:MAG: universal stress protein [Rhizobiales bacterium]|jgi:nucleotide-binding universal stress UspA family protein|nr:universal stress protein [Hyphomicrobiales bacterium]MBP9173584.1 universal stress protein [Hyphomicrobiales bacterium]
MPFKTIMVLLNDSSRTEQLLDAASALARQFDAHLVGLYILPTAKIYADVGLVATPMVFEGYRDLFKSKLAEVRKKFEARAKQDGLKAEWRTVNSIFPEIAESAIAHSRSAELVVTSQIDYGPDGSIEQDFVVRLVMESGRPVLIIPRKGSFAPRGEGIAEKAIVGINGTKESTRAMFDALPLLRLVKETRLVWVDPYKESEAAGSVPGAEEAAVLARHGIKAVAEPMMTDGYNAGEALLMRASDLGADLLVMGAYAHSRMREFVFGGATRHVLEHMTIPVLMSH